MSISNTTTHRVDRAVRQRSNASRVGNRIQPGLSERSRARHNSRGESGDALCRMWSVVFKVDVNGGSGLNLEHPDASFAARKDAA
jgi:hypothetical protein